MNPHIFERRPPNESVLRARSVAGQYLQDMFKKHNVGVADRFARFEWLKPELTSPAFEHFTFSYKNAVFATLVDVVENGEHSLAPVDRQLLCDESAKYNLVPCVFEVRLERLVPGHDGLFSGKVAGSSGYRLSPAAGGWNLTHANSGGSIDPFLYGRDADTRMSEWELRNFAIGIVRKFGLEREGLVMDSFCDIPGIDPQLWFHKPGGHRAWAIVRFQGVLDEAAAGEFAGFVHRNPHLAGYDGYFAPVSAVMADEVLLDCQKRVIPLEKRYDGTAPLYRGHGMHVNYQRMIPIHKAP